jgi:hypothetical protein
MDYTNIPTGLKITTQIPLNVKEFSKDEATLAYLGVDNNLAFTYHDQLEVLCLAEKSIYVWREVQIGEENTGLVPLDFTYPTGLPTVYDINYSGKKYNFFLKEYVTTDTLQDLIKIENVGTGAEVYKGFNSTTNKHEIKTVIIDSQSSNGESFVRDVQENTNDITVRIKKLVSDNLTITSTNDEVRIETPSTASIPALYINSLYVPTYNEWLTENKEQNGGTAILGFVFIGKGSLAQPFTNSITYPLLGGAATITADTAIKNALDGDAIYSYVGSGTRLLPEKAGQKIIVQDNTTQYNFGGNFSYEELNLEVNANINHTAPSYLIDMDNALYFNGNKHSVTITINEGYSITSNGDGLNNSGSNIATSNYSQSKIILLKGKGLLYFPNNNITKYALNSDILSTGNNNDGNVTFSIECTVRSDYQGVYKIGGNSRIYVYGTLVSGISSITINTALKAFVHLGGQVRFFEGSYIAITGARTDGFVFTPTGGFTPGFVGNSPTLEVQNTITNLFNKTNNNIVYFVLIDSQSGVLLSVTNIFESTNLWAVTFNHNNFESGTLDFTKVDLTNSNNVSAINIIGANIIESIRRFNDRAAAISAGVPLFAAYIKTGGVAYPSTSGWVRDIVLPA